MPIDLVRAITEGELREHLVHRSSREGSRLPNNPARVLLHFAFRHRNPEADQEALLDFLHDSYWGREDVTIFPTAIQHIFQINIRSPGRRDPVTINVNKGGVQITNVPMKLRKECGNLVLAARKEEQELARGHGQEAGSGKKSGVRYNLGFPHGYVSQAGRKIGKRPHHE